AIGAILLARPGPCSVGRAGVFAWRGLWQGLFLIHGDLLVLAQTRLDLIHHAQVAEELCPTGINKVYLRICSAVNVQRMQVGSFRVTPIEARSSDQNQERRSK